MSENWQEQIEIHSIIIQICNEVAYWKCKILSHSYTGMINIMLRIHINHSFTLWAIIIIVKHDQMPNMDKYGQLWLCLVGSKVCFTTKLFITISATVHVQAMVLLQIHVLCSITLNDSNIFVTPPHAWKPKLYHRNSDYIHFLAGKIKLAVQIHKIVSRHHFVISNTFWYVLFPIYKI